MSTVLKSVKTQAKAPAKAPVKAPVKSAVKAQAAVVAKVQDYIIADLSLAAWGRKELNIAQTEMPGLMANSSRKRSR